MSFYKPVHNVRAFRKGKKYHEIDWKDFTQVVEEFRRRMTDWYFVPTKALIDHENGGHWVFPIMAVNCLLVDTLSQYYFGSDLSPTEQKDPRNKHKNPIGSGTLESSGAKFKDYLVERMPHLVGKLPAQIKQPATPKNPKSKPLETFQDVLWGFRCGIVHQAATPLYAMISGIQEVFKFRPAGVTTYSDGSPCPTVVYFPQRLFDEIESAFAKYLTDLLNPDARNYVLRRRFKDKFEDSFGVTISTTL